MSGWGVLIVVIILLLLLGAGGWIIYTQYRARRLGLPAPSILPFSRSSRQNAGTYTAPAPAPGGIQGWISSKVSALRNTRTAGGAYESTGYRSTTRGRGALDPDEAWDTRVGNEADYGGGYYEEQELGLQDPNSGPYHGGGYGASNNIGVAGIEQGRGRSRSRQRELDDRYDEEMHGGQKRDPFGDQAERSDMSLRGVSPRPMVDTAGASKHKSQHSLGEQSTDDSPTERRSAFREQM